MVLIKVYEVYEFKRRGGKTASGVQAAALNVNVKDCHTKCQNIGGVTRNFGGIEHFIRGVREILGRLTTPPPPSKSTHAM